MFKKTISFIFLSAFLCSNVFASEEDLQRQINELKKEMREMSSYYETRITELEARLIRQERKIPVEHDHEGECGHGKGHEHKDAHPWHKHVHGILGDRVSLVGGVDARFVSVEEGKNTFMLHEAKIGARARITDWFLGYVTVTKHHGEEVHVEEAYGKLDFKELNLSVKAGQFFVNFGTENRDHFFERRTITLSAMHEGMFGEEPWSDVGMQVDLELPVPFYSNVSVSVLNGNNAASFGDGQDEISNNNLPVTGNWTNAFDTEYGLFKLGNSFAVGQWDRDDKYNVYLAGGDAYYKLGNFDAQAELIYRWKELPDIDEKNAYGYYLWCAYTIPLQYKYLKGIELLTGFGQFIPDTGDRVTRITPQINFLINEFAKLRATYEVRDQHPEDRKDNRFITQFALAF